MYLIFFIRINKPGGCAKITKVHYAADGLHVESVDVKYVLGGGFEKEIDPAIVSPFHTLQRDGRKRRGRDFLMDRADDVLKKVKHAMSKKKTDAGKNRSNVVGFATTTTERPDHSTSPSTPVTPERPAVKKSAQSSSKEAAISMVPSYVITDASLVKVSPLQDPVGRKSDESKQITIARRGLFGPGKTKKVKSIAVKENQKDPNVARADDGLSSSTSSPLPPKTSQDVQRAHSAAVKQALSKKHPKFVAQNFHSSDRKDSACGTSKKTASLQNVFDLELRKARAFLDEVCKAPANDSMKEEKIDPTSKENRLDTSGSEAGEDDCKQAA